MPRKNKTAKSGLSGHVSSFQKAGPYLSIGYVFLGSIIFFSWIGYKLDRYYNTDGMLLLAAVLLALGLSFYRMILIFKHMDKEK